MMVIWGGAAVVPAFLLLTFAIQEYRLRRLGFAVVTAMMGLLMLSCGFLMMELGTRDGEAIAHPTSTWLCLHARAASTDACAAARHVFRP